MPIHRKHRCLDTQKQNSSKFILKAWRVGRIVKKLAL